VIQATEKTLRSPDFAEIAANDLAPGEQQRIEAALAALKAVIGGDDRDAIHQRTHELNDVTKHLAEVSMNRSVHAALSGRSVNEM
jgi:Zn-dependent oligopeptidase